jgi:hyperosmotically inducible periplasmic protein
MRFRAWNAVVVALFVGLAGCATNTNDPGDRVDRALKQANVKNVNVDYDKDGRVVHLKGSVDSPDERARAEQVATDVVGTSGKVLNELTVEGMDSRTADDADSMIKSRLNDSINADPQLTDQTVDFNVNNGMVTVTGEVQTTAQKERVGQVVKGTAGVRDVANELKVKEPEPQKDGRNRK